MNFTNQDFQIFLGSTTEIVGVLDANGRILKANPAWEKTFARPLEAIIGIYLYELFVSEDSMHYKDLFETIFVKEKATQHFFPMINGHGDLITLAAHMVYKDDLIYLRGHETTTQEQQLINLRMLSKTAKIGAWYYNVEKDEFTCSSEFYRIYELQEGTPIKIEDVFRPIDPESLPEIKQHFQNLEKEYQPFEFKTKMITEKGTEKWIDCKAKNIIKNRNILYVTGIMADITMQQNYIEKLKYNSETQELALKGIKSAIFDHDLITNKLYYSYDFKKILGLPLEETYIPEAEFRKMIHPEDVDKAYQRHLDNIDKEGFMYFNNYRLRDIDGNYNHYEVHAYRKKDANGKAIRMIGNLINIEDRVLKNQDIERYQRRLKAVINNGYLDTVLVDPEGYILFVDDHTHQIIKQEFGVNIEKERTPFIEVIPNNLDERFLESFERACKGEKLIREASRLDTTGRLLWYEVTYTPIRNTKNDITSILINFVDITKRKNAEFEIKQAQKKTEELSKLKSNILMNLSHEIRTPLNGIIGVNELLARAHSLEDRKELLSIQKDSSERLINTLEGMIKLSHMESLNGVLEFTKIEVNKLIEDRFKSQLHLASNKKLDFKLKLLDKDLLIKGDLEWFKVAMDNIINNAIKYTETGKIIIRVGQQDNQVKIEVKDTGIGIEKSKIASIFEMFVQESQGLSRKYEGTGIGLTMSKKYIELMDGTIHVKSTVGKGSLFIIKFPLLKNE